MAHEINNPIGITYSRLEYLNLECEQNHDFGKYKGDIDVIISQLEKVSSITKNILKYSKKLPKDFANIELIKIVTDSIFLLEPRLKKNNISILKDFIIDRADITGDAQQIEQVIINLINNAIDAMPDGGNINIQIKRNKSGHIEVTVSDNGSGINEQDLNDIFSPFFTTKSGDKGTGLGLYIVKNILKNHNAVISCNSKINRGTTFILIFNKGKNK
jgi:signal transduction histidine kinase